jgi:hypothetical protein
MPKELFHMKPCCRDIPISPSGNFYCSRAGKISYTLYEELGHVHMSLIFRLSNAYFLLHKTLTNYPTREKIDTLKTMEAIKLKMAKYTRNCPETKDLGHRYYSTWARRLHYRSRDILTFEQALPDLL